MPSLQRRTAMQNKGEAIARVRWDRRRFLLAGAATLGAASIAGCANHARDSSPVLSEDLAFAFDPAGNRYEMDFLDDEVRRVDAHGAVVWRQGSASNPDLFNYPTSMAVDDDGTVFVADRGNGEIERLDGSGTPRQTFGGQELTGADDLALESTQHQLYVSDHVEHHVRVYSTQGASLRTIGDFGLDGAGLNGPRGVAISPARELHVVDSGNGRVQVFTLDGSYRRSYGDVGGDDVALLAPRDIVFDGGGRALVSDPPRQRLARYEAGGAFIEFVHLEDHAGRTGVPLYLAVAPDGRLYATVAFV